MKGYGNHGGGIMNEYTEAILGTLVVAVAWVMCWVVFA